MKKILCVLAVLLLAAMPFTGCGAAGKTGKVEKYTYARYTYRAVRPVEAPTEEKPVAVEVTVTDQNGNEEALVYHNAGKAEGTITYSRGTCRYVVRAKSGSIQATGSAWIFPLDDEHEFSLSSVTEPGDDTYHSAIKTAGVFGRREMLAGVVMFLYPREERLPAYQRGDAGAIIAAFVYGGLWLAGGTACLVGWHVSGKKAARRMWRNQSEEERETRTRARDGRYIKGIGALCLLMGAGTLLSLLLPISITEMGILVAGIGVLRLITGMLRSRRYKEEEEP